jgi:hypothetical protein
MSYRFQVPAKWVHEGKEYSVSMAAPKHLGKEGYGPIHAVCLEPRTGKAV